MNFTFDLCLYGYLFDCQLWDGCLDLNPSRDLARMEWSKIVADWVPDYECPAAWVGARGCG